MPYIGLSLLIQIALIIHVLRTGRAYWWIFLILFFPVVGSAVYVVVEILPSTGRFRFLRAQNREAEAIGQLADLDRRLEAMPAHFKPEANSWRAHAVASD